MFYFAELPRNSFNDNHFTIGGSEFDGVCTIQTTQDNLNVPDVAFFHFAGICTIPAITDFMVFFSSLFSFF